MVRKSATSWLAAGALFLHATVAIAGAPAPADAGRTARLRPRRSPTPRRPCWVIRFALSRLDARRRRKLRRGLQEVSATWQWRPQNGSRARARIAPTTSAAAVPLTGAALAVVDKVAPGSSSCTPIFCCRALGCGGKLAIPRTRSPIFSAPTTSSRSETRRAARLRHCKVSAQSIWTHKTMNASYTTTEAPKIFIRTTCR